MNLSGFGIQFWKLPKDLRDVTRLIDDIGAKWVSIKVSDGHAPYLRTFKRKEEILRWVEEDLAPRGVVLTGWGYFYGRKYSTPAAEARAAAAACDAFGIKVLFLDVESEWRDTAEPGDVEKAISVLRDAGLTLLMESWKYPSYHQRMRYREWADAINAWAPQVYWIGAHNSGFNLRRSHKEHMEIKPLPFVPILPTFAEWGWAPHESDFTQLITTVTQLKIHTLGVWKGEYLLTKEGGKLLPALRELAGVLGAGSVGEDIQPESETLPASDLLRVLTMYDDRVVELDGRIVEDVNRHSVVFADGSSMPTRELFQGDKTIEVSKQVGKPMRVTAYALNVRAAPSLSAPVVGRLHRGDIVVIVGEHKEWRKTGDGFWVHGDWLTEV